MTVAAAFLVPGSPLPFLKRDNPPWADIATGFHKAARAIAGARPDTILLYSTQWMAVLDELWQTRARIDGVHVDENWYEYGDLSYALTIDTELASACVDGCRGIGVHAKGVDYDAFPIDTGTIVANHFLNPEGRIPLVVAANNVYHDWETTRAVAAMAAAKAHEQGKKVAAIGVGGLSGTIFRDQIDIAADHIAGAEEDRWNRRMLELMEKGEIGEIERLCPDYTEGAKVDMGFKHFAWVLGAIGGRFYGAKVHAYGPTYGSGAAVVEFRL